ncbi:hypothetical protein HDU97_001373 [Phlyctochytrium planicorne]|nr:hypothetical protein HDU97_001373 [Phlyctochytrium planicorne]
MRFNVYYDDGSAVPSIQELRSRSTSVSYLDKTGSVLAEVIYPKESALAPTASNDEVEHAFAEYPASSAAINPVFTPSTYTRPATTFHRATPHAPLSVAALEAGEGTVVTEVYQDFADAAADPMDSAYWAPNIAQEISADIAELRALIEKDLALYPENEQNEEAMLNDAELKEAAQRVASSPSANSFQRLGAPHEGTACRQEARAQELHFLHNDEAAIEALFSPTDQPAQDDGLELLANDGLVQLWQSAVAEFEKEQAETELAQLTSSEAVAGKTAHDFIMPEISQRQLLTASEALALSSGSIEDLHVVSGSDFESEALDALVEGITTPQPPAVYYALPKDEPVVYYALPKGETTFDASLDLATVEASATFAVESESPVFSTTAAVPEFLQRQILTQAEFEDLYTYDPPTEREEEILAQPDAQIEEMFADFEYPVNSELVSARWEASMEEAEAVARSFSYGNVAPEVRLDAEVRAEHFHENFGDLSSKEVEVDQRNDIVAELVDKNEQVQTEPILAELNSHRPAVHVDSAEVISLLLREARRIQWNKALEESARLEAGREAPKKNDEPAFVRSTPAPRSSDATKADARVMSDVYSQETAAGLVDSDAALQAVLTEAMRLLELKAAQNKTKKLLAKL